MGLTRWLIEKERRFAWSLAGTIVGLASLYFGYASLRGKQADMTFGIISDANVLDVHTAVPSLDIRFQGEDIEQKSLNLKIITIQLENTGEVAILQNQYDQNGSWGFTVRNGRVIEARVVRSNDRYLEMGLRPVIRSDSVVFEKPIFERGSLVVLEVLVLHPRQTPPAIVPYGKIAGISSFKVRTSSTEPVDGTIWSRAIFGSIGVQGIRLGVYTFGFFLSLLVVAGVAAGISSVASSRARKGRRKEVAAYLRLSTKNAGLRTFFADLYVDHGVESLLLARSLLSDERLLRREMLRARSLSRHYEGALDIAVRYDGPIVMPDGTVRGQNRMTAVATRLYSAQIAQLTDDRRVTVAEGAMEAAAELILLVEPEASGPPREIATAPPRKR